MECGAQEEWSFAVVVSPGRGFLDTVENTRRFAPRAAFAIRYARSGWKHTKHYVNWTEVHNWLYVNNDQLTMSRAPLICSGK